MLLGLGLYIIEFNYSWSNLKSTPVSVYKLMFKDFSRLGLDVLKIALKFSVGEGLGFWFRMTDQSIAS